MPLRLSVRDRELIVEHAFVGNEILEPLRMAVVDGKDLRVSFTLPDLEELSGALAAEANHCKSKKLERELDALWEKVTDTLHSYDDGLFNDSEPR